MKKFYKYENGIYTTIVDCVFAPSKNKKVWLSVKIESEFLTIKKGVITVKKGFKFNGLTKHKDHYWLMLAAAFHDAVLPEDLSDKSLVDQLKKIDRKAKDQLFLEVATYKKSIIIRIKSYIHYIAVRAYSILKEVKI